MLLLYTKTTIWINTDRLKPGLTHTITVSNKICQKEGLPVFNISVL